MGEKEKTPKTPTTKIKATKTVTLTAPIESTSAAAALGEAPPPKAPRNRTKSKTAGTRTAVTQAELAQLGGGAVAYIKVMSRDEALAMFPGIEGLPTGIDLYALHAADGTPLALTDSRQAAIGQAMGSELAIASLH